MAPRGSRGSRLSRGPPVTLGVPGSRGSLGDVVIMVLPLGCCSLTAAQWMQGPTSTAPVRPIAGCTVEATAPGVSA